MNVGVFASAVDLVFLDKKKPEHFCSGFSVLKARDVLLSHKETSLSNPEVYRAAGTPLVNLYLATPNKPSKPEPKSHAAAGIGTAATVEV